MKTLVIALGASGAAIAIGIGLLLSGMVSTPAVTQLDNFGIIVNTPAPETNLQELDALYAMSASLGSSRSNVYVFWNAFELEPGVYNWDTTDTIMSLHANHGLKATVFFSVVNGKTFGPLPSWMGSLGLEGIKADDVSGAIGAIASRYSGVVDTIIIAGDADAYFESDRSAISVYNDLFDQIRDDLGDSNPNVRIGNAFSLDRVLNRGTQDVVSSISSGDFVAFTYRPINVLNEISKDPSEALDDLLQMSEIAGGVPVALFEVGWSTAPDVFGSKDAQVEFTDLVLDLVDDQNIEFVTWYRLHDRPVGTCSVEVSLDEGFLVTDSGEYSAQNLGTYICSAGLLDSDGVPKPAWHSLASAQNNN